MRSIARESMGPFSAPRDTITARATPSTTAGAYTSGAISVRFGRAPAGRSGNSSVKCSSSAGSSAIDTASPQ